MLRIRLLVTIAIWGAALDLSRGKVKKSDICDDMSHTSGCAGYSRVHPGSASMCAEYSQ